MKTLCLFDFDGTITNKDSLPQFVIFAVGRRQFYLGLLKNVFMLAGYLAKFYDNETAKQKLIYSYFKNWPFEKFESKAQAFSLQRLDKLIRPAALEKIKWHQAHGHTIYLVSASMETYLAPWCELNNIKLLGSQVKSEQGKFPQKFSSPNCYGPEKAKRIQSEISLDSYNYIYAYGDSRGDKEMLALADEAVFKPFRY